MKRTKRKPDSPVAQVSFFDEIAVDGFCGGGGWSTGFEEGICRPVDVAINHSAAAIAMHKKNHPYTHHYQCDIFEVDPVEACRGRPVGWAHFSPDCKHFSRAKGAKPVNKHIRSLAWVVIQWAAAVKPRIISMENVTEFLTWGPCIALRGPHGRVMKRIVTVDGKGKETVKLVEADKGENVPLEQRAQTPDPKRKGLTFAQFVGHLKALGYTVEWNELVASDYGAPTSRRRFFLLARRDGRPIIWPEPTHGDPKSEQVRSGQLKPWRTAAEIIDWSLPCPSIFERKRPLAENTMKRIAKGLQKFVIDNPEPFIVQVNHSGDNFRGQSLDVPIPTVTAKHGFGLATPYVVGICQQGGGDRVRSADDPLTTICSKNEHCVVTPYIMCNNAENLGRDVQDPVPTITARDRFGLVTVSGVDYQIVDIGLRMLTPRELYNAQGFPFDYVIDVDCHGNVYPKNEQVARCGNAVPPAFATALVRANWPEACGRKVIRSMAEFNDTVAV